MFTPPSAGFLQHGKNELAGERLISPLRRRNVAHTLCMTQLIEHRHIEQVQLLQLAKVLLLLVEREELLGRLPDMNQLTKEIVPIQELSRAS
jgi:hypothetical protein